MNNKDKYSLTKQAGLEEWSNNFNPALTMRQKMYLYSLLAGGGAGAGVGAIAGALGDQGAARGAGIGAMTGAGALTGMLGGAEIGDDIGAANAEEQRIEDASAGYAELFEASDRDGRNQEHGFTRGVGTGAGFGTGGTAGYLLGKLLFGKKDDQ